MKKQITALSTAIAVLVSVPALAQNKGTGYYDLISDKTVLTLTESASQKVEQDRIKAALEITKGARESAFVQNFINEKMETAVKEAKRVKSLKVSTGSYRVNQRWDSKARKNDGWEGSQEIILDTANKDELLDVVQKLQKDGFTMKGMNYYLSNETAATYRTDLIKEALKRVQDRAKSVAEQLGAKHHHIGAIDVSNEHTRAPRVQHMTMAKAVAFESADMAAPVVEGSEEDVSIRVNVKVILDMND